MALKPCFQEGDLPLLIQFLLPRHRMQLRFFLSATKNRQDFSVVRRAYAERSAVASAVPVCATVAENATKIAIVAGLGAATLCVAVAGSATATECVPATGIDVARDPATTTGCAAITEHAAAAGLEVVAHEVDAEFDKVAWHAAAAGYTAAEDAAHVSAVLAPVSSPTCVSPVREGESLLDVEELPRPGGSPRYGLTTPRPELCVTPACVGTSTMDEIVAFDGI
jgi:hypothetical protein